MNAPAPSPSPEQKPQLQPVHRIFLGEMFVFVVFFAGAMSVLVGPLRVEVQTAAITIGASVVLSALCFFWLAFTTPTRKDEPRYAYMALSLLPAVFICAGLLGFQSLAKPPKDRAQLIRFQVIDLEKAGPNFTKLTGHPVAPASQLFAGEIAAMEEALAEMGFVEKGYISGRTKSFVSFDPYMGRSMAVETTLDYAVNDPANPGRYWYQIALSNFDPIRMKPYAQADEDWLRLVGGELKARWLHKLEEKSKANGGKP